MKIYGMMSLVSLLALAITACGPVDLQILTVTPSPEAAHPSISTLENTATGIAALNPTAAASLPAVQSSPTVPAAPSATPPVLNPDGTYTVQPGDTLFRIALQFGITVETIQTLNNLNGTTIYPGQVLRLSGGTGPAPTAASTTTPAAPTATAPPVDGLTLLREQVQQDLAGLPRLTCHRNVEERDAFQLRLVQALARMLALPAAQPYRLEALQAVFAEAASDSRVTLQAQSGQVVMASTLNLPDCVPGSVSHYGPGQYIYIIDRTAPGSVWPIGVVGRSIESVLWLPERWVVIHDEVTAPGASGNNLVAWHITNPAGEWEKTYELALRRLAADSAWQPGYTAALVAGEGTHRIVVEFESLYTVPPCELNTSVKDRFEAMTRGFRTAYAWQADGYRRVGDDELRFTKLWVEGQTPFEELPDWETYCVGS
jgi:LysM repeat protein